MLFPLDTKKINKRIIISEYFKKLNYSYYANFSKSCSKEMLKRLVIILSIAAARSDNYNMIQELDNKGIVFTIFNFRGDMAVYDVTEGDLILIKETDKKTAMHL